MKAKRKKLLITLLAILLIIPNMVLADGVTTLIDSASVIVKSVLIPLAFSLALLYFFWGVTKYIRKGAGDERAMEDGKKIMVWGIVGLFVAFSIWGIIAFIQSELGIPGIERVEMPLIEATNSTIIFQ